MKERSCVYRFVEKSQQSFAKGQTLHDVNSAIPHYRKLVRKAYGHMDKNFDHHIATSTTGLRLIAVYEFSRYKGLPLPDANTVVQSILPLKKKRASLLLKEENMIDNRSEQIEF